MIVVIFSYRLMPSHSVRVIDIVFRIIVFVIVWFSFDSSWANIHTAFVYSLVFDLSFVRLTDDNFHTIVEIIVIKQISGNVVHLN